jgi:hypothetical protein
MATTQPSSDVPSGHTSSTGSLYKEDTIPEKQEQQSDPTTTEHPFEKWAPDQDAAVEDGAPAPPNPMDPASFPDGGTRAWLVVLGGFCCLIVSFGMFESGFSRINAHVDRLDQLRRRLPSILLDTSAAKLLTARGRLDPLTGVILHVCWRYLGW